MVGSIQSVTIPVDSSGDSDLIAPPPETQTLVNEHSYKVRRKIHRRSARDHAQEPEQDNTEDLMAFLEARQRNSYG